MIFSWEEVIQTKHVNPCVRTVYRNKLGSRYKDTGQRERDGEWSVTKQDVGGCTSFSQKKLGPGMQEKAIEMIAGCTLGQVLLSAAYLESNAFTDSINNNFLSPVGNPGQLIQYVSLQGSADSFI